MTNTITSQAVHVTPHCSVSSSNETNTFLWNDAGMLSSRNYTVWNLTVSDLTKVWMYNIL